MIAGYSSEILCSITPLFAGGESARRSFIYPPRAKVSSFDTPSTTPANVARLPTGFARGRTRAQGESERLARSPPTREGALKGADR